MWFLLSISINIVYRFCQQPRFWHAKTFLVACDFSDNMIYNYMSNANQACKISVFTNGKTDFFFFDDLS